MPLIAIITDYGTSDWFAGEMKAAMVRHCPQATLLDITHHIEPGDTKAAAFTLLACYRTFPAWTVFCVVVDPGVGTSRAALAIKAGHHFFVGPDNGVLSWAVTRTAPRELRRIECPDLLPPDVSHTFHGRDIFGPVAAHLACGTAFNQIGPVIDTITELPWPQPVHENGSVIGSIVHIDRFGNAVTSIDVESLKALPSPRLARLVKYGTELPLCTHFQQVPTGQGLSYIGSSGFVEVAINNANAAAIFGLRIGDKVAVE